MLLRGWSLPRPPAVEGLRSFSTSSQAQHPYSWFTQWSAAQPPSFRRRKITESNFTISTINTPMVVGAVPKTTAALADFQLHTQLHDSLSPKALPGVYHSFLLCLGERKQGCLLGFLVSRWRSLADFPCSMSCCRRADTGNFAQFACRRLWRAS